MSKQETSVFTVLGGVVAGLLSFGKWGSVLLALIQGLCLGWIYVVYFLIRYGLHNLKF
jgi:hypothetical protein